MWSIADDGSDPTAKNLVESLFEAAGTPYLTLLSRWITAGDLVDTHGEFMVVTAPNIDGWDRFALRNQQTTDPRKMTASSGRKIIVDLLASQQDRILLTGKYWRVLRDANQPPAIQLEQKLTWANACDVVDRMYQEASRRTLDLMRQQDLMPALR